MKRLVGLLTAVLLWTVVGVSAQDVQRLRMAHAYEQGGNLKGAARIYMELYEGGNTSDDVFAGVVRTMTGLKNHAGLLPMVTERYSQKPTPALAMVAASLQAQLGSFEEADDWWSKALDTSPNKESASAEIGRAQSLLLLRNRAIESYSKARSHSSNSNAYALQLSRLYTAAGETRLAAEEILNHQEFVANRQETLGKLSALMTTDSAKAIVGTVLSESSSSLPDRARILVWYYQQMDQWEKALEETYVIDDEENMRGNEILRFAATARRAGKFSVALSAYGSLLDGPPQVALAAAYGYARALEQRLLGQDDVDEKQALEIIGQYQKIIDQHGDHPLSAAAMVRCAELYDNILHDEDRARDYLTRVTNTWKGTSEAHKGALHLSDLYIAAGQLQEARKLLEQVSKLERRTEIDIRDKARLKLADLDFFAGNIDEAKRAYLQISQRTLSVAANDALDRLGIIMMLQEDSVGVSKLVQAMFLQAKRDMLGAARSFVSTSKTASNVEIQDRCLYLASTIYYQLGKIAESETTLEELLKRIPSSIYGDRALSMAAQILLDRGDKDGAIAALTTILVQYPRSILVPESREKIRRLRGDA